LKNIQSEYASDFKEFLKLQKFDKTTNELLNKIRNIRNSRIAHLKGDTILNGQIESLNLNEIENLINKFNDLLQALSFNVERIYLPLHYTEHNKQTTDIEIMLLVLAQNSNILNLPEQSCEMWERYKQKYPKENVIQINKYREKLGLPMA